MGERGGVQLGDNMDREYMVTIRREDLDKLREWLKSPNGGLRIGRVTFESVEDGSIWVRTQPFRVGT